MSVLDVVAVAVGSLLVLWMLIDSFETLLATNLRSRRFSFTQAFYAMTWRTYRAVVVRIGDPTRRERWLARYGPASFLGLLVMWTGVEIFGWGLVWWGVRDGFATPIESLGDAWYYSGVVYFSIGFGDILPATGLLRLLTVVAGLSGLGTLGLVIGYLPSLNAAYSARERKLLLLDDLTDERITPVTLLRATAGSSADSERMDALFDEWADWCAEVYDSHTSFPVLVWFRSKHRGNSWVTALGVVTDAAIAFDAGVLGSDTGSAVRLQRQATRLVQGLAVRIGLPVDERPSTLTPEAWQIGYQVMVDAGLPMRSFDESFERLNARRDAFHPYMEAFIDELLTPRGFWGVTAADHMAASSSDRLLGGPGFDELEDLGG